MDIQKILNSTPSEKFDLVQNAIIGRLNELENEHQSTCHIIVVSGEKIPTYKILIEETKRFIQLKSVLDLLGISGTMVAIAKTILPTDISNTIDGLDEKINDYLNEKSNKIAIKINGGDLQVTYINDLGQPISSTAKDFFNL